MQDQKNAPIDKATIDKIVLPEMGIGIREVTFEITNACNLRCVHCYAESDSRSGSKDKVTEKRWKELLNEAIELGTTNVQISGGEPSMNPYAGELLKYARNLGFKMVKLYTNGLHISDKLLDDVKEADALVKVTFFSYDPAVHDKITTVNGSHGRTSANIRRMNERGIKLRAGIVLTPFNNFDGNLEKTIKYLNGLGVKDIRHDYMHGVGRGYEILQQDGYSALCGMCWTGKLAIDSEGYVHPCVMSRFVNLGNITEQTLVEILDNPELMNFRKTIYAKFGDLRKDKK